ncbi:MAG: anthranilate phosphoribosyltransferase [bacterium]
MTIQESFAHIIGGNNLTSAEAESVMGEIVDGLATAAQIGFLLGILRIKGETAEEIAGFVQAMRDRVVPVHAKSPDLVDTCGTGGDKLQTFNLSTASAFVAAAAGVPIAKHGNRAMSSKCGSADVLEALGVNLERTPEQIADSIDKIGIGFMFAPKHHPALKYAAAPRREIGVRTFFNLVGPMTNPAQAKRQFMGVYDYRFVRLAADVLNQLGCEKAVVAFGIDGIDEMSPIGQTLMVCLDNGHITEQSIEPEEFGIKRVQISEIAAGQTPDENAVMLRNSLREESSPCQRAIVLNAAAAIWVGGKTPNLQDAVQISLETLKSGAAKRKLQEFIEFSHVD